MGAPDKTGNVKNVGFSYIQSNYCIFVQVVKILDFWMAICNASLNLLFF
jgi:hypothetical protein